MILGHYESIRAAAPCALFEELVIKLAMMSVSGIKYHERSAA